MELRLSLTEESAPRERSLWLLKLRRRIKRGADAAWFIQPDMHDWKPLIVLFHHAQGMR